MTILVFILLFFQLASLSLTAEERVEDAEEAEPALQLPLPQAKWTFMVYLDADNNLEGAGIEDFNEMETVGSTEDVNCIVQMDRCGIGDGYDHSNGDWTGAKRFYVTQDSDTATLNSVELEDLDEINMGDPAILVDFATWTIKNFPAERYALVLWNHGGGFHGVCWDDDNDEDHLSMPEVGEALANIRSNLGRNFDLVGFDACLMGNMEVLYELFRKVDVAIGSGYNEPGEGWPYEMIMPELVANPDMSSQELGHLIAEKYVESYTDKESDPSDSAPISQAAFDMTKFGVLEDALSRLGMYLATHADLQLLRDGKWLQIQQARSDTNSYDATTFTNAMPLNNFGSLYDLVDLLENLGFYLPMDTTLQHYLRDVESAVIDAKIYSGANPYHERVKDANGLTLWFPFEMSMEIDVYSTLAFTRDSYWDEFLNAFVARTGVEETPPLVRITTPGDDPTIDLQDLTGVQVGNQSKEDQHMLLVKGTMFDLQQPVPVVEVRVNEDEWSPLELPEARTGTAGVWEYAWSLPGEIGNDTLHVRAKDSAGQYSVEDSLTIHLVSSEEAAVTREEGTAWEPVVAALTALIIILAVCLSYLLVRRRK